MKRLLTVFILMLLWVTPAQAGMLGTSPLSGNFVYTSWGMESGLPQSSVNDIIQDRDGYIWLATFGGLVRFDGKSFTTFNRSNTPGMRSDRILHMYEDSKGIIWLSTEDGFLKFDQGVITPYMFYIDNQVYSASRIREDGHDNLWIVVHDQVKISSKDGFKQVEILRDDSLTTLALENPDGAWLIQDRRVMRTIGEQVVEILNLETELQYNLIDFLEYPQGSGIYFMASTGEGVIRYANGNLTKLSIESGLPSRYTWKLREDLKGNMWVISYSGVSIWNDNSFVRVPALQNDGSIQYLSMLEDNEGNYWLGSNNDGLTLLRPAVISTISENQGLDFDLMLSLTQLKDGTKVFGTNCGGVFEYRDGRTIPSAINEYLPNLCIWSVFEDSQNRLWFGSRMLYRSSSLQEPGNTIGSEKGFDGLDVFTITEDSKGRIWIGSFNGIHIYENDVFTKITTNNGLSSNDTRFLFEDNKGTMWAGTSNGLNIIKNGKAEQIPLFQNPNYSDGNKQPYVRAIHQDSDGGMWIGTYGYGVFRLHDGYITNIRVQDGLFDDIVSHIVEDDKGYFWMGSNRGISRVSRNELVAFTNGEINRFISISYGTADGMLSPETNGGFQPSVIKGDDNKIYFPTVKGVAVVDLNSIRTNLAVPNVFIEQARTGKQFHSLSESIQLPHDNAFIEIDFTALSYSNPDKIQFRYKMEGLDQNWFEVGGRRSALYTKIPPGDYHFVVTASSGNNIWNETGASLAISIIPPFWNRPWFYALTIYLLVMGIFMFYSRRLNHLKQKNEQKTKFTQQLISSQEKERHRIAMELHDGLGQQLMIIKNRAEMAQLMLQNTNDLKNQLSSIIESSKISITDIRNITHALRPVHLEKFGLTDAVVNLCEQLKRTSQINWTYEIDNIDGFLPDNMDINLFRVIQEATNNIQKHAKAGNAAVFIHRKDSVVQVLLQDNGIGGILSEKTSSSGLGLLGMRERVETMGGIMAVNSAAGNGTKIEIRIPSQKHGK